MTIYINQNIHTTDKISLMEILAEVGIISTEGLALAINQSVISRAEWQSFQLHENDKITIIRATQGG